MIFFNNDGLGYLFIRFSPLHHFPYTYRRNICVYIILLLPLCVVVFCFVTFVSCVSVEWK